MKKALLIGLVLGLIVAFAAPAMAIDWSARGGFSVKSAVGKNIDQRFGVFMGGVPGSNSIIGLTTGLPITSGVAYGLQGSNDPMWNETFWWLQMRGDIFIYARASADLYGVFGIEVNSFRFGDADTALATTGSSAGLGSGIAGRWNADAIAIQVKTMLIDFKVPSIPVWFRVGIQPYMIRPVTFLYVDAIGITARTRFSIGDATMQIEPFWAVIRHGTWAGPLANSSIPTDWTTADDGNLFGVNMSAAIGTINPGVFFAMQRVGQLYGNLLAPGTAEGNQNYWWISPYVDAKFGPVDITLDWIYSGGYDQRDYGTLVFFEAQNKPSNPGLVTVLPYSRKHSGWLLRGVMSLTMNKLKVGVGGLYGTGDDPATVDTFEGFQLPYRSEAAKFNDDLLVVMGDWGLRQTYGCNCVGGFYKPWSNVGQGIWYVRAFADFALTDWLKLKGNFAYIGDTVNHGDQFGTDMNDDQSIGWEMDFGVQIDIYKNLTLDTAFGYLIGGKALLSQYIIGDRAQDPWTLQTVINYSF